MASPRSLKLSPDGKRQVYRALTDKAWRDANLAEAIGASDQTAKKFRLGQKVDRTYFVKFCQALGLDWEIVIEAKISSNSKNSNIEKLIQAVVTLTYGADSQSQHFNNLQVEWGTKYDKLAQFRKDLQIEEEEDAKKQLEKEIGMEETKFRQLEERIWKLIQQHCREKILHNYSEIRLLSGEKLGVDQLYVDVWLLNREPRTFRVSQNKMLKTFDLRPDRLGLGDRLNRNDGLEVANQESKLLILGKPGAGKTTFLKHLAVDWCNGNFQSNLIAVFIEFRQIRDEKWQLLNVIRKELNIQDKRHFKKLLNDGKLLILMDGFDEVPTQELRTQVQHQLVQVVRDYSENSYIMTCRTQIMKGIPDGFTLVEVADFNDSQVEIFVRKWFHANGGNEISTEKQWGEFKLAINLNPALKELTPTPVLLGLMCLVLQDEGEIPAQMGLLYERGIKLLLQKWNDDKAIYNWEMGTSVYQKLDIEQKEKLLINIAAHKFENPENFVLFEQRDLIIQIAEFLKLPSRQDAIGVLKAIESQHGLIVERADELWSFSHLTFQEYFTTKWLLELAPSELSHKISNNRWQEVVQQLIKAQGQSDRLVRLIKQAIDYVVSENQEIQYFLDWVQLQAQSILNRHRKSARKHFNLHSSNNCSKTFERILVADFTVDFTVDLAIDNDLTRNLNYIFELVHHLYEMGVTVSENTLESWWHSHARIWERKIRKVITGYRNIGYEWQLTDEQEQILKRYYDANNFLVELLKIPNALSPEVRQEIEDNLLLPIAELKRRLPDQYGGIE